MKIQNIGIILIGIIVLLAYCFGLFVDLTGDAGKYAAISRHIFESGDWINLKIHNEPYDQKPPLIFWLSAVSFKLFGMHNWSFKILPVLYGFTGGWFTFQLGKSLYNRNVGVLAAIMLVTSWVYFMFSMDVHTDLILTANVTFAIWQLVEYEKTRRRLNFILAFVGVGLAMLTKGPVGAAIPAFALVVHLLVTGKIRELFSPKWLIGISISGIVCIPAFVGLYNQFGLKGIQFFFFTNNIGRITGSYVGSNTDYFFYIHTLFYLLLPWTFLLLFAFYHEIKDYFTASTQHREYYTVGGIWLFFLIISIAKGKAPHYVFPVVPMILIVVARWVSVSFTENKIKTIKRLLNLQIIIPILLLFLLVVILFYVFPVQNSIFIVGLLVLVILLGISLYFYIPFSVYRLILPSVFIMSVFIAFLNAYAIPKAFSYQGSTRASRIYNNEALEGEKMYNYLYHQFEVYFYSKDNAVYLSSWDEFSPDKNAASWIYTTELGKDTILSNYDGLVSRIDTLPHRGMTSISPHFLNPKTREESLTETYLIKLDPGKKDD